ncbi:hypothetical protein KEM09_08060 [Carboxylicivirga mesophila]|uniref:CN hydrolase domain-containing protein n=1 Tax=Carboxylicivirga mesophila TaxID=1166478 RepID=A0ABS5K8L8_9BACT|nr:nitrilase-related carbon-nitrogen hydrolase [Carboxylicivirga mesophila]MBS2211350.1 hypothetical protein [Carboxylicivirga mesophila]
MKVSIIQMAPQLGHLRANIETISSLIEQSDSDLFILPELANSGYNFQNQQAAFDASEKLEKSVFIEAVHGLAKIKNTHIVTGFCERDRHKLYNSSVLIAPKGVIGIYRKLHLFLNEKNIFNAGNLGLPVFDTELGKIAMLVCFDWMFPEVWRKLALKGAQLIAHPSNLVLPYCQGVVPSYALVNRCYIATANRIGTEGNLTFSGQSILATPNGETILRGTSDKSQVLSAEIDLSLANNKYITELNDVFKDRRPDVYGNLEAND